MSVGVGNLKIERKKSTLHKISFVFVMCSDEW
jgi:hypothetical protein